jgi:hypothetical protein
MSRRLGERRVRVAVTTLAATQIGQARSRVARQRRAQDRQLTRGPLEFALGLDPVAAHRQHHTMVRAAESE